jgi:hypothetical protein
MALFQSLCTVFCGIIAEDSECHVLIAIFLSAKAAPPRLNTNFSPTCLPSFKVVLCYRLIVEHSQNGHISAHSADSRLIRSSIAPVFATKL